MSNSRSFIDVLFILLIGAIVMLSQSVRIGSIEAAPAKVDADDLDMVSVHEMRVVIVMPDHVVLDDASAADPAELAARLAEGNEILLVSGRDDLSHQRMMTVWAAFSRLGVNAQIGVEPLAGDAPDANNESIAASGP